MMVDVVMEMDDIDIGRETVDVGRIEMARDKLTERRISRSQSVAKRKSGPSRGPSRKSKHAKSTAVSSNFPLGKKFRGFRLSGVTANYVRR
jgi:hypothetical protein